GPPSPASRPARSPLVRKRAKAGEALACERSDFGRFANRAVWLRVVAAIAESAFLGESGNVGEALLAALLGLDEPDLPHAGVVDEQGACRQRNELAVACRVASSAVAACRLRPETLVAQQAVQERRLADAGRAEPADGTDKREVPRDFNK